MATIDEIRSPEAMKQFAALEDQAFAVPANGHYLDDFPIWNSVNEPAVGTVFRIGAFDGPKLIAATGVRLAEIRVRQGTLTGALIGAVATASEFRGQGLATQLVSLAVEWATERGAALAILWGSEHILYGKIGFAPCGTQATIPLSTMANLASSNTKSVISTGWTSGLMGALKGRSEGIQLRDVDRSWLSSHKNVKWFWTGDAKQVTAYAALGRGIDLSHFVHEWGGDRTALLAILGHIHSIDPQAKLLGSPELFSRYGFQHDPGSEERLCLARVIDAMSLFNAVHPKTRFAAAFIKGEWKLNLSPKSAQVGSDSKTVSDSLPPLEASKLFFGPVPAGLGKPWSDYFPLPLWFWGLDAV
jgi:GNAT superfamily N-acetyltransferase